ncbi:amino acid-binding protein [Pantoea stewartii subsp. indologenes]|uniref:amino acid-binding protein n=1 Tax=Pantoea stewartii TaxID=66269 RepID=UPI003FA42BAF
MFNLYVVFRNEPGSLAAFGTLLGQHGIGLEGGGVFSTGKESHAHFLVEDGPHARQVLVDAGFDVRDVRRPLRRKLPQQRPGELGEIAQCLAQNGINIRAQYSDHSNWLVLITDDDRRAEALTRQWKG